MSDFFAGEPELGVDYSGTVAGLDCIEGKFGPQITLVVDLDQDSIFTNPKTGEVVTQKTAYYGVPDGWAMVDGRLMSPDGNPDKALKANNKFQRVCQLVGDMPEARAYLTRDGLGPYHEAAWIGARFHFNTVGAGEDYNVTDKDTGVKSTGKTKGFPGPVEWLGSKDAPVSGQVGASAPAAAGFSIASLPDDVIEVWGPLAESTTDNATFMKAVLGTGLLSVDKLGQEVNGLATKALGDGTLREALSVLV